MKETKTIIKKKALALKKIADILIEFFELQISEHMLSVQCSYKVSPPNHKSNTSSLVPPTFYVAEYSAIHR